MNFHFYLTSSQFYHGLRVYLGQHISLEHPKLSNAAAMLHALLPAVFSEYAQYHHFSAPLAAIAAPSVATGLDTPIAELASRFETSSPTKQPRPANASNKVRV